MVDTHLHWGDFIEKFYAPVFRFCLQFLGSRQDAEDVAQETFLRAFQGYRDLKNEHATKAWIYSIARNFCIDRRRWWKRYQEVLSGIFQSESHSEIYDSHVEVVLAQIIKELPQRQREIFILRHFHGFSTAETATILKIEEGSVKSHLKRGVDKIKREFIANSVLDKIEPELDSSPSLRESYDSKAK